MNQLIRVSVAAVSVAAALAQGPIAPSPYAAFLQARYPNLQKVNVQTALADARQAGLVVDAASTLDYKRTLRQLRSKERRARPSFRHVDFPRVAMATTPVGVDVAAEFENNDGWQWADDAIGQSSAAGDCSAIDDNDYWRIVSTGEFFTFTVAAAGAAPITDSILTVRNDRGDVLAFNDDNGGLLSQISMYLPPGLFFLEVSSYGGTGGGTYDLQIQSDPVALTPITAAGAAGTTRAPLGGQPHDVFTFTVPSGSLGMVVTSGQDTVIWIQRADGLLFFTNDDSGAGGLDAAVDIDLPAGSYTAYVSELTGLAGLNFTLSFSHTPGVLADVASTPSVVGVLAGEESLRLYRANLTTARRIDMTTSNGPTLPVLDTILALYDPSLDFLCDVDDDNFANPARGFYSRITVDLPAASYFVGVTPWPGSTGDFTLSTVTSTYAPTGTAQFGPTPTTIAGFGRVNSYLLDNATTTTTFFGADDYFYAMIDPNGELASCWFGDPNYPQGGETPAGRNTVLIWDRYDYTGPLNIDFRPALHVEAGSLRTRGKAGDITFLFGQVGGPTPGLNLGIGDRGLFALPLLTPVVSIGLQIVPPGGVNTWFVVPPGSYGVTLQSGDLHTGVNWVPGFLGTWRNVRQF